MAWSFGALFSKSAFGVLMGHLVTGATLLSGKELPDAETCCHQAGEGRRQLLSRLQVCKGKHGKQSV